MPATPVTAAPRAGLRRPIGIYGLLSALNLCAGLT